LSRSDRARVLALASKRGTTVSGLTREALELYLSLSDREEAKAG
jgi:hypothetical protein